jgi:hypothetical protein
MVRTWGAAVLRPYEERWLAGEGVHGPGDANSYDEEKKKGPENVADAVAGLAAAEETESDGNDCGEKQKRLEMR